MEFPNRINIESSDAIFTDLILIDARTEEILTTEVKSFTITANDADEVMNITLIIYQLDAEGNKIEDASGNFLTEEVTSIINSMAINLSDE